MVLTNKNFQEVIVSMLKYLTENVIMKENIEIIFIDKTEIIFINQ